MSDVNAKPLNPSPPYWAESGNLEGWVHATDPCSTANGPGMRYTLTLSGCPLRCQYCHSPDTWYRREGNLALVTDVLADISRRKAFLRGRGGITITGGEPLMQPKFCKAIFKECKAMGLHTALDTSGHFGDFADDELLANVDLVQLDIKAFSAESYRLLTASELEPTLRFANVLAALNKVVWLKYVVVPGVNDQLGEVESLAKFAAQLGNVEQVDVIPFEQHGGYKWRDRGYEYQLGSTKPPSEESLEMLRALFRTSGLNVQGH